MVVSSPAGSKSGEERRAWRVRALSLPPDQERRMGIRMRKGYGILSRTSQAMFRLKKGRDPGWGERSQSDKVELARVTSMDSTWQPILEGEDAVRAAAAVTAVAEAIGDVPLQAGAAGSPLALGEAA